MYRPLYGHILWFLRVEWPDNVVLLSVFKNLQIGRQHPMIVFCTFCQQSLRAPVSMSLPIHSSAAVGIFVFSKLMLMILYWFLMHHLWNTVLLDFADVFWYILGPSALSGCWLRDVYLLWTLHPIPLLGLQACATLPGFYLNSDLQNMCVCTWAHTGHVCMWKTEDNCGVGFHSTLGSGSQAIMGRLLRRR